MKYLLLTLFFTTTLLLQAQLTPTKSRILLSDGQEVFGFAKRHGTDIYLYSKRKKSKDKVVIPISSIKSIAFVFKEGYRKFDYLKSAKGKYRLLIPLVKGKVNLYKSFGRGNMSKINSAADISYKVSKDGISFVTFKNFKKEAIKFFGDCDLIVEQLKSRNFYRTSLAEMVIIYNNDCTEDQKSMIKLDDLNDTKPLIFEDNSTLELSKIVPMRLIESKKVKIIRKKVMVDLNTIYFNLDKAELLEVSLIELDKLVSLMNEFPRINIEVGSHTDSRGSEIYNLALSSKRAKEVVTYLIKKGINKNRINAIGYGENQPVNKCVDGVKCSELEYEKNRRTEFIILNPKVLSN